MTDREKALKFVRHIEAHLTGPLKGQVVLCKICGKTIDEIARLKEPAEKPVHIPDIREKVEPAEKPDEIWICTACGEVENTDAYCQVRVTTKMKYESSAKR